MAQEVTLSIDLFNAILANLSNQPYAQVAPLLETIKQALNEDKSTPESAPVAPAMVAEGPALVTE